jgi:quinol monooxygenase YgiN
MIFYDLSEAAVRRKLNTPMKPDTCISLHPYFLIQEGKMDHAMELQDKFMFLTEKEEGMLYYGFSTQRGGNEVHCREGYESTEALLAHLDSIGETLGKLLEISTISRLEAHGPAL